MSKAKRFSRRWTIQLALAIVLGAAAVACVSVSGDVVGRLVDERGCPAAGAYIAYYYSGTRSDRGRARAAAEDAGRDDRP
jgi:hypothetical protein